VPAYQAAMWILPGVRKHLVNNFTKCQEISGGKKRQKFFFQKALLSSACVAAAGPAG
jgi:hypothetical protein